MRPPTPSPPHPGPQRGLTPAICLVAALAGCVSASVSGLRENPDLFAGGLLNPDSSMRLVRLNDMVVAGRPLHAVMRDSSGLGSIMSWTHLLDSLLLLLAAPLAPFLGWHAALHAAGLASAPLSMAALGIAAAWAAAPLAPRPWLWAAAFAAGTAPSIGGYGQLGVVHHHIALVAVAITAAGWALRLLRGHPPVAGGVALGACITLGLWFSPESLFFAMLALGALWADWFGTPARARSLALLSASATFTVLTTLAWLADPPSGGLWANEPDRLSLPFVLLGIGATATALVAHLAPVAARPSRRRLLALVTAATAGALWLASFPELLRGTAGLMTPEQAQAFFGVISEMMPVSNLYEAFEGLLGGVFALVALAIYTWRFRRTPALMPLLYSFVCLAGLMALADQHLRFATYPAAAGAVLLPIVIGAVEAAPLRTSLQAAGRMALLLLLFMGPRLGPAAAATAHQTTRNVIRGACALPGAVTLLSTHPGAVVLTGVNDVPDLLYRTQIRTVGSLYHRNPSGFLRLAAAWNSIPGDTPGPEFLATRATLVLICPTDEPEDRDDTLVSRLRAGNPPSWLHRIADAGPRGYVLYALTPPENAPAPASGNTPH